MNIIVIGSGVSGLTAAAYFAKSGNTVVVYEQYEHIGGVTATVTQNGFSWDLGPLQLDKFEPGEEVNEILRELDILERLEIIRDDRGMAFPDFDLWKPKEYGGPYWRKNRLKELFPEDAAGIDEYYKFYDSMIKITYFLRKIQRNKGSNIFTKIKLWLTFLKVKKMSGWSAKQIVEHFFTNPKLRAVFTGILADFCVLPGEFAGLGIPSVNLETAFDARIPLINHGEKTLLGFSYIRGGTGKIVNELAAKITQCGGLIKTNHTVERIIIKNKKAVGVEFADGSTASADLIIASGGVKETFYKLVGRENLPESLIRNVESVTPMDSVFMVHLGVDFNPLQYQKSGLCYYYGTYNVEEAILRCRNGIYHEGNDGFLIYVPTSHSPEMAPEGHHAITIYTIAPNNLQNGTWQEKKDEYAEKLIEKAQIYIPGLSNHIVEKVIMTPVDFRRRTHLEHHAFGGIAPVMGKHAPAHFTPIEGLCFIGAQSESGGGVSGTMIGARKVYKEHRQRT